MTVLGRFLTCSLLLLAIWVTPSALAQHSEDVFEDYARLLERHAVEHELDSGGLVSSFDYEGAARQPESKALIERQRQRLSALPDTRLDNRETALAFWINAYNFFMIAHIVDNPIDGEVVGSVKDFGSLFNPYRVFRQEIFEVAGRAYSLDDIEKGVLLGEAFAEKGWKDARVHFAVNCASVGCPALRDRIYTRANIADLLEQNTRRALRTPLNLSIVQDTAHLTRLFDWYENDFEQAAGSVPAFIEQRLDGRRRTAFVSTDSKRFIDYDWSLNSPGNIRDWLDAQKPAP